MVSARYLPLSRPLANGTRARIPTPASTAAGSTNSSGFNRKAFRMIWTVAVPRREIAVSASSQVSTLTPYAGDQPFLDQRVQCVIDGIEE